MSSDFEHLTGKRDFSTPMPMTGKPYVKTYYDWTHYCWRTDVCILLGAREEAPGVPWGERLENRGKGREPDRERKDLSPQGRRQAANQRSNRWGMQRDAIRRLLRERGQATTVEVAEALGMSVDQASAILNADTQAMPQLKKTSRNNPQVWVLLEEEEELVYEGVLV
ncbi:MAG TPA: hypothetical protein PKA43_00020 [Candidatus Competibacter phosphatis]|nr:hypothetical protein [Candidatus Competibacter phosphatis]